MSGRTIAFFLALALAEAALDPSEARATDVGEIALLPDDGTILNNALLFDLYVSHASCAFYRTRSDDYDALFIWTSAQLNALTRTQQGWPVRAAARGIGFDGWFDLTNSFCAHRLRHAVKMGDIDSFSDDPDALYTGALDFTMSGIELMGHEFGHQWMAGVTFKGTDGIRHCLIRGLPSSSTNGEGGGNQLPGDECDGYRNSDFNLHWSAYFNTGSVMYGNTIADLGGGNFLLTNHMPKYSPFDQYLMGLRDAAEVPPMFVVDIGVLDGTTAAFPVPHGPGQMITGTRMDFTVDDVVRAEGARVPAHDMCHWKAAFVIVHPPNAPPTPQQIARVDTYRRRWEAWYAEATDQRGSFDTTLQGTGLGTSGCPGAPTPHGDGGLPEEPDGGFALDSATHEADAAPPAGHDATPIPATDAGPDARDAGLPDGLNYVVEDTGPLKSGVHVLRGDGCSCSEAHRRRGSATLLWVVAAAWAVRRKKQEGAFGSLIRKARRSPPSPPPSDPKPRGAPTPSRSRRAPPPSWPR